MKTNDFKRIAWVGIALLSIGLSPRTSGQTDTNGPFAELKKQQEQLTLENGIAEQQLRKDLAKLAAEKQRLELENGVAQQKQQAEIAALQAELDKLTKQADVLAKRATLKETERKAKLDDELAASREKLERMKLTNDLAAAVIADQTRELARREQELKVRTAELQAQRTEFELQLAKINTDLDLRVKRDLWKNRVNRDIQYTKEPFKDGVLTISDRRIALNGPIWMDTADYVVERIDYFNNQSQEYPIFIVIDSSPGGSVMAGYRILKAMEGSPAPVYVVVKSFAASMAAGITTLSKKSYIYPNAIMLHHQISSGSFGNLTMHKEDLKELEEWWKRLAAPIAAKMGISLDEFIKRMYANRSTGDWEEFGDNARKLKWADEVAQTIQEESYDKNPDAPSAPGGSPQRSGWDSQPRLPETVDATGHRYVLLPRLEPVDCYYLYDPDNYYRLSP
ncbi:MAG TPA: ATP-dependent Clp protease proteolytic subunit [Candidatus Acidoferrum sp.]|nr:ATP-dependent Clp protease proteolytic subunit [Candidatus Acidoferrum sp.]